MRRPDCFWLDGAWSSWHLQCLHHFYSASVLFHSSLEHSGRVRPLREAPCKSCTYLSHPQLSRSVHSPNPHPSSARDCRREYNLRGIDPRVISCRFGCHRPITCRRAFSLFHSVFLVVFSCTYVPACCRRASTASTSQLEVETFEKNGFNRFLETHQACTSRRLLKKKSFLSQGYTGYDRNPNRTG